MQVRIPGPGGSAAAGGGGGGITFIAAAQASSSSACVVTLSLTTGDTAIIGVGISLGTSSNLTTPVSSGLETVSLIGAKLVQSFGAASTMAVYEIASAAGGSEIITETPLAGNCGMVVFQFRGSAAGAIDGSTITNNGNFSGATSVCTPSTTANTCDSNFTPGGSGEAAITFVLGENFSGGSWSAGAMCGGTGTIPSNGNTSNSFQPFVGQYFLSCPTAATTSTINISGTERLMGITVLLQP